MQKSETLQPGGSGTLVRYVSVAALNRARQFRRRLAAVPALLSCACRIQMVGVDDRPVGRLVPGALRARQCGPCPAFNPSHHGCLQLLGLDGPVSVTPGVLGHHGGAGGRFKFAAPTLRLLALWVARRIVPPAPHVNITMFEDCNWAGETSYGQTCGPVEDLNRGNARTQNRKKSVNWSGRRESNPHDQLGRLVAHPGRTLQLAAMTRTYKISAPLFRTFG
jgi:hypothetical protein